MSVVGWNDSKKTFFFFFSLKLDPAVKNVPYPVNIDIRSSVNYKEVMKQYQLGPNGAIVTSLNLFATQMDRVVDMLSRRAHDIRYCLVDTPGQIEVFTWSASGSMIEQSLGATTPTCVVYCMDCSRVSGSVASHASNMLYACSIAYKSRLPFLVALNKSDACSPHQVMQWMQDPQLVTDAVAHDTSYVSSLTSATSMVLHAFYQQMQCVPCSALTGQGIEELLNAIDMTRQEYYKDYLPELKKKHQPGQQQQQELAEEEEDSDEWSE